MIALGPAVDVTGREPERLNEYARLMESNRAEAEKAYDLACTQLNSMMAVTAVALSIIASGPSVNDQFRNGIVLNSLFFIAVSLVLSGYASTKSRRMIATYPNCFPPLVSATNTTEMKVASINMALMIEEVHRREVERNRFLLDFALSFFLLGIGMMMVGVGHSFFV